jgi:hypothetical protein
LQLDAFFGQWLTFCDSARLSLPSLDKLYFILKNEQTDVKILDFCGAGSEEVARQVLFHFIIVRNYFPTLQPWLLDRWP